MNSLSKGKYDIYKVRTGYTGGIESYPSYSNTKGHWEAIQIWYDGSIDTFKKLI